MEGSSAPATSGCSRRWPAACEEVGPALTARVTESPPIVGAALLGLDAIGAAPEAHVRLREELGAAAEQFEDALGPRGERAGILAEAYLEVE